MRPFYNTFFPFFFFCNYQADDLRQQTLQQMHHILTTRQSARALLAINDYISCLWALSSLWLAGLLGHENEKHKNYLDDAILKTDSPHPMKWSLGFEFVQDQSYDSPFNGLLLFFNPKLPLGLGCCALVITLMIKAKIVDLFVVDMVSICRFQCHLWYGLARSSILSSFVWTLVPIIWLC